MKNFNFSAIALLLACGFLAAFAQPRPAQKTTTEVQWLTFEQAVELNKTKPKKIAIDVFTEWCGWCKRMDQTTFVDAEVTKYLVDNFYCVKLDAEQKADINWNGQTFKHVLPEGQKRGINTFAYSLLDGKLGYPTIVYLNEKFERIMISPGYKEVPDMMKELRFAADEIWKTKTWEDYKAGK